MFFGSCESHAADRPRPILPEHQPWEHLPCGPGDRVVCVGLSRLSFDFDVLGGFSSTVAATLHGGFSLEPIDHHTGLGVGGILLQDALPATGCTLMVTAFFQQTGQSLVVFDVFLIEFQRLASARTWQHPSFPETDWLHPGQRTVPHPWIGEETFFGGRFEAFPVFGESRFFDATADPHELKRHPVWHHFRCRCTSFGYSRGGSGGTSIFPEHASSSGRKHSTA